MALEEERGHPMRKLEPTLELTESSTTDDRQVEESVLDVTTVTGGGTEVDVLGLRKARMTLDGNDRERLRDDEKITVLVPVYSFYLFDPYDNLGNQLLGRERTRVLWRKLPFMVSFFSFPSVFILILSLTFHFSGPISWPLWLIQLAGTASVACATMFWNLWGLKQVCGTFEAIYILILQVIGSVGLVVFLGQDVVSCVQLLVGTIYIIGMDTYPQAIYNSKRQRLYLLFVLVALIGYLCYLTFTPSSRTLIVNDHLIDTPVGPVSIVQRVIMTPLCTVTMFILKYMMHKFASPSVTVVIKVPVKERTFTTYDNLEKFLVNRYRLVMRQITSHAQTRMSMHQEVSIAGGSTQTTSMAQAMPIAMRKSVKVGSSEQFKELSLESELASGEAVTIASPQKRNGQAKHEHKSKMRFFRPNFKPRVIDPLDTILSYVLGVGKADGIRLFFKRQIGAISVFLLACALGGFTGTVLSLLGHIDKIWTSPSTGVLLTPVLVNMPFCNVAKIRLLMSSFDPVFLMFWSSWLVVGICITLGDERAVICLIAVSGAVLISLFDSLKTGTRVRSGGVLFMIVLCFDFFVLIGVYGGYISDLNVYHMQVLGAPMTVSSVQCLITTPLANLIPFHLRMMYKWFMRPTSLLSISSRLLEIQFEDAEKANDWIAQRHRSELKLLAKKSSERLNFVRQISTKIIPTHH